MKLTYCQTKDPETIQAIGRLRSQVWRGEKGEEFQEGNDPDCWLDRYDGEAYHWLVTDPAGKIIAAARLSYHERLDQAPNALAFFDRNFTEGPIVASFNRLVVHSAYRGHGIARQLDALRLEHARLRDADLILALPVGGHRADALKQIGFIDFGAINPSERYQIHTENIQLWVMAAPLTDSAKVYLQARSPFFNQAACASVGHRF